MKIVFITTFEILGPQKSGGEQCANRNLSLLRQCFGDEDVYVCAITENKEYLSKASGNTTAFYFKRSSKFIKLRNVFQGRWIVGKHAENAILEHIISLGCDAVFLDRSLWGFLPKRLPKNMKKILFLHNMEFEYAKRHLRTHPKVLLNIIPLMLNEATAIKNANVIITLNKRDDDILQKEYNYSSDLILPITFDDYFIELHKDEDLRLSPTLQLLFVGTLFSSNEIGIMWFINHVMPHIKAELSIVGRDFEKLTDKLIRHNVKVIGTVDDLSYYYNYADAVVSPILAGAGMKVKTAEAIMYGKPMFATDEALEGYKVEGIKNIYRCNSPQEFIEAINSYAKNPPYLPVDNSIRELFLKNYHTPAYIPLLRELLIKRCM